MVIFNSYVSLPEGIVYLPVIKHGSLEKPTIQFDGFFQPRLQIWGVLVNRHVWFEGKPGKTWMNPWENMIEI